MDTTEIARTPELDHRPELPARTRRAIPWTTAAAAAAGAGGAAALAAGLTGHGATSSAAHPAISLLHALPHAQVAVLLGAAGLLVALGMLLLGRLARVVGRGEAPAGLSTPRMVLAAVVPLLAVLALASTCDANPLAFAGYLPLASIGSLFSAEMRESWATLPWLQMLAQLTVAATAIMTVAASLRAVDTLRGPAPTPAWQRPAAAARWGRTAVAAAVAIPLLYAVTRFAWVLGWPVGFDAEAYADSGGDVTSGGFLAVGALVGSILTVGLVRPRGERFWSWLPRWGGRRVPVPLAVIPASTVAALLLPAGVSMIVAATEHLGVASLGSLAENWAAIGVTFLWPIWSLALAVATWAYALRRQGEAGHAG